MQTCSYVSINCHNTAFRTGSTCKKKLRLPKNNSTDHRRAFVNLLPAVYMSQTIHFEHLHLKSPSLALDWRSSAWSLIQLELDPLNDIVLIFFLQRTWRRYIKNNQDIQYTGPAFFQSRTSGPAPEYRELNMVPHFLENDLPSAFFLFKLGENCDSHFSIISRMGVALFAILINWKRASHYSKRLLGEMLPNMRHLTITIQVFHDSNFTHAHTVVWTRFYWKHEVDLLPGVGFYLWFMVLSLNLAFYHFFYHSKFIMFLMLIQSKSEVVKLFWQSGSCIKSVPML